MAGTVIDQSGREVDEGTGEIRALQSYQGPAGGTLQLIDIDAQRERLDNMRQFVKSVLDPDKGHYGRERGIDRDFLHQPGAEILYQALGCEDRISIVSEQLDWERDWYSVVVKCEVVSRATGIVVASALGACNAQEKATNCYYADERVQQGPKDIWVDCPLHGRNPARTFWKNGSKHLVCAKKILPALAGNMHNILVMAQKRAYVGAIRHAGCVSEMFTDSPDTIPGREDGDAPPQSASRNQRERRAKTAVGKAAEAVGPEPQVPEESMKDAMARIKAKNVKGSEIKSFIEDNGGTVAGASPTAGELTAYANGQTTYANWTELADAIIERFGEDDVPTEPETPAAVAEGSEAWHDGADLAPTD